MSSQINIMRGSATLVTVNPISGSSVTRRLMGTESVSLQFDIASYISFQPGDFITVQGVVYTMNLFPTVKKTGTYSYNYALELESPVYQLLKTMCLFYDANNVVQEGVFSVMNNPLGFAQLLVLNLNRLDTGWTVGATVLGTFLNVSFSDESCMSAINKIATAFATEWYVVGKTLNIQQKLNAKTTTLSYQGGIFNLTRSPNTNGSLVTRLYVLGGTKNLPTGYDSAYVTGGYMNLHMPSGATHLDSNIATYGTYEEVKTFDTIFPNRQGAVTKVNDYLTFVDSTMDFDVNAYMLSGLVAQVSFLTGQLAGYTFNITGYAAGTMTYSIAININEKSLPVPSAAISPSVGDLYVLLNISLPPSYITQAENLLQTTATAYMALNSVPRWAYDLTLDGNYLKNSSLSFDAGDQITIVDAPMSINSAIRVMGVTYGLLYGDTYKLTLGDSVVPSVAERIYAATDSSLAAAALAKKAATVAVNNQAALDYIRNALHTSIQGGLVTTVVLQVGSDGSVNGGISGAGTDPTSIRFWAGSSYGSSSAAPFRVQNDGTVFMSNANIQNGCKIGNWTVDSNGLKDLTGNAFINISGAGNYVGMGMGGNQQGSDFNIVASFITSITNPAKQNIALSLSAFGSSITGKPGGPNLALNVDAGSVYLGPNADLYAMGKIFGNLPQYLGSTASGSNVYKVVFNATTGQFSYVK